MEEFGLEEINVSHRELRDGLLVDYLSTFESFREFQKTPIRNRSILDLSRSCNYDEKHSETVASLATQLFDSAKAVGLHNLGKEERELLDIIEQSLDKKYDYKQAASLTEDLIRNIRLKDFCK